MRGADSWESYLAQVRAPSQSGAAAAPRTLSFNPAENAVLVSSDADGGSYQLYIVPKDGRADSGSVRCFGHRHRACNVLVTAAQKC